MTSGRSPASWEIVILQSPAIEYRPVPAGEAGPSTMRLPEPVAGVSAGVSAGLVLFRECRRVVELVAAGGIVDDRMH